MPITLRTPTGWLTGSAWLFLLLALLTILPAACVLWFMNDALARESASSRQRVLEAYRAQLRLVRSRLDPLWRAHAARLNPSHDAARWFDRLITDDVVDGAIVLAEDGTIVYPSDVSPQGGAFATLTQQIDEARRPSADRDKAIEAVAVRVNDYSIPLSGRERLQLMDALRAVDARIWLPTQAALRLSLEVVDAERPMPVPDALRPTGLSGVWTLTSDDHRVIALYRIGRLEAMMHDFLHEVAPAGITFVSYAPDRTADAEAIAAGSWLPGWQLSFMPLETDPLDGEIAQRRLLYISVAVAGIVVITFAGVAVAGTLRRHLRVAKLKTDLVAATSHELRTPLASMRVLVDGLLADAHLDQAKTREYLELLAAENARLSRLIENFLTFARIERHAHTFTRAPLDPSAIVSSAVEAVRGRVPPTCDLRIEIEANLPLVMGDADALGTALVNLLDNAVKYTPGNKRIVVRAARDGNRSVLFAVEDNGIGIPAREQRRIFKRFYRVERRLSSDTSGVGLGLSIVQAIVRGHQGTVTVRSVPGTGSTFTMRVPAAGRSAA